MFERSLALLAHAHLGERLVKTGLMVGLGEREDEVLEVLSAIPRPAVVTIGQYLRPTRHSLPVQREVGLEEFQRYTALGQRLGLRVAAGPLVRSSFHAAEIYQEFSSMDAVHGAR